MLPFKNKAILIVSVKFFNYENLIKKEIEVLGGEVDLYDERPSNTFYSKAVIRLKKSLYNQKIRKHFNRIISEIKHKKYDFFLLIKGEAVPLFFLDFLRKNNPGITLIYYTYDSFRNNPNGLCLLKHFDKKFTFDTNDAVNFKLGFRPLFFAGEYTEISKETNSFDYDLSFVGTAHSDRYSLSQTLTNWALSKGLRCFNFYYSPSKFLFFYRKLTDKNFLNFDKRKISFISLKHREIIDLYRKSKVILDINHPGQNGLTMRTFETLGAGRKLITTNATIVNYPFYNPNNILIIDRNRPELSTRFFELKFQEIDDEVLFSMSLRGWLKDLFEFEISNLN